MNIVIVIWSCLIKVNEQTTICDLSYNLLLSVTFWEDGQVCDIM